MKKVFMPLILLSILIHSMSFTQEPTSALPGGELFAPGDAFATQDQTILDAQLYMPETFSPTDIIPPSRERESMLDYTSTEKKQQPIFWGGLAFAGQYGQFDKLPFADIYVSPYFQWWKFFFMYEAPLRFDWNGSFVSKMWNSSAALISKIEADIYYAKTNHTFRHVQASIYRGEDLFLGHGRFFYDYNPNLYSPYEPFKTFKLSLDTSYFGLNYIIANIAQPDLMSAEIFIRPFAGVKRESFAIAKDIKIYGVYGVDLDPFQSYSPDLYEFSPNDLSPKFCMFEFGIDFPFYKSDSFDMNIFVDYAFFVEASNDYFTIESGSGISMGVVMDFFQKIPLRFEISPATGYWEPRWVNVFYYVDRPYVDDTNKYTTITPDLTYFTGSIGFNWIEKSIFAQAEVYGDFTLENLWVTLSFTVGNIFTERLSFSAYWTIRDFTDAQYYDELFDPKNNVVDLRLKYHMMPNMYWGLTIKFSGRVAESYDDDDEAIIDTTSFILLGVDFAFRF